MNLNSNCEFKNRVWVEVCWKKYISNHYNTYTADFVFILCSCSLLMFPLYHAPVCRITHYEERLKALYFKKKFQERRQDCKQKIEGKQESFDLFETT